MAKATEGSIVDQQDDTAWEIALIMDKATANDKRLTFTDKIVFAYIQGFTRNGKWCFASSQTIAAKFGLTAPYIRQSRSKLEKMGLLQRETINGRHSFRTLFEKPKAPEAVSEIVTPEPEVTSIPDTCENIAVRNSYTPVRKSYTECKKILHPLYENLTHNSNININLKENHRSDHARAREGPALSYSGFLKNSDHVRVREGATSATGESFLEKVKEGEQPTSRTKSEQWAEGRDRNAKMDPAVAKQKFAELMATLARRKSS